jgi:hypothetical protein
MMGPTSCHSFPCILRVLCKISVMNKERKEKKERKDRKEREESFSLSVCALGARPMEPAARVPGT